MFQGAGDDLPATFTYVYIFTFKCVCVDFIGSVNILKIFSFIPDMKEHLFVDLDQIWPGFVSLFRSGGAEVDHSGG